MPSVNILGLNYKILFLTTDELIEMVKDDQEEFENIKNAIGERLQHFGGLCHPRKCEIYINKDLEKTKIRKVLAHEIMEAIAVECQLELEHIGLQAIVNALWIAGILDLEELVKDVLADRDKTSDNA